MRILFDQGTPVPLRRCLSGHVVATAYELGWSTVTNGDLIRLAEQEGYELLITIDTNPSLSAEPEKAKPCHPGAQHYQLAQDSSGHRTRPGQAGIPIEFKRLPKHQPQASKKLLPVGFLRIHSWNLFDPPYGRCSSRGTGWLSSSRSSR
jgi:hypothetical protein